MIRRVLIAGLDAATPELVFHRFRDDLPNLKRLMGQGTYAPMKSCHPPITIPAWAVMATGKSPGQLGLYGFRHRKGSSYKDGWIANSQTIHEPALWNILGRQGRPVCLVGVPPSYPPFPVNGNLLSCFITPDLAHPHTYPPELAPEIASVVGEYLFDVEFRTGDRDALLAGVYEMTEKRFKVLHHLLTTKPWDLAMFVEIGVDRIQHAFWKYFDPGHPKYVPGNKYENAVRDYYRYLDKQLGGLLAILDQETAVVVVSDHGAKGMRGAFCVNQWLMDKGYLQLKNKPDSVISIEQANLDWPHTRAWGWGGYYARIFFNVKGREPQGIIEPGDLEAAKDELILRLKDIRDPAGRVMATQVYRPEELYPESRGDKPDLMVYFDELFWRSAGTIGHGTWYLDENDTGPDDAVHAQHGIFILYEPGKVRGRSLSEVDILDIAPTVLRLLGIAQPKDMVGHPVVLEA